jgi:hypothetical protein
MSRLPEFLWSFDPESFLESTFAVAGSEIWFWSDSSDIRVRLRDRFKAGTCDQADRHLLMVAI